MTPRPAPVPQRKGLPDGSPFVIGLEPMVSAPTVAARGHRLEGDADMRFAIGFA